jgi:hypothetical protein
MEDAVICMYPLPIIIIIGAALLVAVIRAVIEICSDVNRDR